MKGYIFPCVFQQFLPANHLIMLCLGIFHSSSLLWEKGTVVYVNRFSMSLTHAKRVYPVAKAAFVSECVLFGALLAVL